MFWKKRIVLISDRDTMSEEQKTELEKLEERLPVVVQRLLSIQKDLNLSTSSAETETLVPDEAKTADDSAIKIEEISVESATPS